jgi:hypothetical protein
VFYVEQLKAYAAKLSKCFLALFSINFRMAEKRRFTLSLPEHIAEELERRSEALGSNPTEYAADIIRWWYGQSSPSLTDEEKRLLTEKPAARRAS